MSDAAYIILGQKFNGKNTGQFYLDDEILNSNDKDFNYDKYKVDKNKKNMELSPDLML